MMFFSLFNFDNTGTNFSYFFGARLIALNYELVFFWHLTLIWTTHVFFCSSLFLRTYFFFCLGGLSVRLFLQKGVNPFNTGFHCLMRSEFDGFFI